MGLAMLCFVWLIIDANVIKLSIDTFDYPI